MAQTLLSQTERKNLKKVVNTLASYNVTYKQTRGDTGYEYKLDPPLDQLVNFAACSQALAPKQIYGQYGLNTKALVPEPNFHEPYGKRALAREQRLTYHSKQILVQEVAQQKMRMKAGPSYSSPTKAAARDGGLLLLLPNQELRPLPWRQSR